MKIKIPIPGTVGKSVNFDPNSGARAEAAVAALAAQINAGLGANIRHSSLSGLQIGDDHPQYTGNQFPETITGQWNFQTIPFIQGETLAEYIEDVVGGSFFDFLQDTTSVVWTYFDSAQELEANVPPEFVQDVVGAMLTDTTSIDLAYNDGAGTFTASIIDEYVQDLVGAMLVDTSTVDFTYDDALGQISAVVPGAALSRTNDTNVTLTLGGTPLTALARAASLTLGWTGQLAVPRGGLGLATVAQGDLLYGSAADTYSRLTKDAVGTKYLTNTGASNNPAWAALPGSFSGFANPGASVGLAAVNGSATTAMRSDGAPALSQSIAPLWTGLHIFEPASGVPFNGLRSGIDGAGLAATLIVRTDGKTVNDGNIFAFQGRNTANATVNYGFIGSTYLDTVAGTEDGTLEFYTMLNGTGPSLRVRIQPNGDMRFVADNQELQLGASQDLRLYHDGTNSFVRNDTGALKLTFSTNVRFTADTTGVSFNGAATIARPDYTVTNPTTNRSIDVSTITAANLAQVVGTMIQDLINYGLYQ